jgi:hypothetical protein
MVLCCPPPPTHRRENARTTATLPCCALRAGPLWHCMTPLVASSCVEAVLNDLLSVLARTGARYPLLCTPKDVPAKPCPASTHLTLGSPEGTPGATAVTQTRATCRSTSACGGLPLCGLHLQRYAPSARHLSPPRDRLGPLRECSRLQGLPSLHEELARHRDYSKPPAPTLAMTTPVAIPLTQGTLRLIPDPAPGNLDGHRS